MTEWFKIEPGDSPIVRALKAEANAKLAALPPDPALQRHVLSNKADYFAASALRIRPKETEGGLAPFAYNPIQMDYLASLQKRYRLRAGVDSFRGLRDIILKPRQLGFTTFLASIFFQNALFNPGRNCLVLTHLDKISQEVLDIYRTFYDCLPPLLRQNVRLRRASALHLELEFLGPDGEPDPVNFPPSSFMVHTAAGLDIRGVTIHDLHCSEAAFYPNWAELVRGVFQAVPSTGNIILESTANGFNHYKDLVDAALDGKGAYRLIFYPWFAHPEYAIEVAPEKAEPFLESLDRDERVLMAEHHVTLGQVNWRRCKILEMGGFTDSFRQEYPANIQDAFIASGRPIFDLKTVAAAWELARKCKPLYDLEEGISIYVEAEDGGEYVLAGDPAEGIEKGEGDPANEIGGTDYSSAFIADARTLRIVAHIHGRFEPVEFARKCARVGAMYDALIVIERNNHGHLVLYALEESGYPRLYRHLEYDAAGTMFLKLGFPMTPQTRPLVVDALAEVVRREALPCPVAKFWGECMVFVRDPAGKPQAMPSRHDDRVMSMAILVYACTLGAKAWGGTGILQNPDAAGLPRARRSEESPAVVVPSPENPLASTPPIPAVAPAPLPEPVPVLAGLAAMAPDALGIPIGRAEAPALLTKLADARKEHFSPDARLCGTCCHMVERDGQAVCRMQGFLVQGKDPACQVWEAPEAPDEGNDYVVDMGD